MKRKYLVSLLLVSLFLLTLGLASVEQTAAQTQGTENLLVNPGFEEGHHKQDGIPEITVPNGWRLHWLDNAEFPGSDGPAARPESVVWFIGDAPADEQGLFFRDGSYALKVFKGGRPVYAALSQDVSGLEVGRRYRLVAPVYIDIVSSYNGGNKLAPGDLESGLVRLGAGPVGAPWLDEASISYSGFWTAATISPFYLAYPVFVFDFTATQPNMTVYVEFGSRDPYPNNGFFLDTIGLYTLDEVDTSVSNLAPVAPLPAEVPSGPTPTPFPTPTPRADGAIIHVVQAGESFWSIAIQYASALGLSAEEALPVIRELNGNPAFLNVGQEVIIALPDENAAASLTAAGEEGAEPEALAIAAGGDEEEAAPTEEAAEPTATPEPEEAVVAPVVISAPVEESNTICVSAFEDVNGDSLPGEGEGLLADAVFTISHAAGNLATYVSDGINEPYCLGDLEADTYQISFSQPPGYKLTTAGNWAIAIADGAKVPVEFGAQLDESAPQPELIDEVASAETAEMPVETAEAATAPAGVTSNVGIIALGIAVVLVLLAGVGIVLLRRS